VTSNKIKKTYTLLPETIAQLETIKKKERLPNYNYAVQRAIEHYAAFLGIESTPQPTSKLSSNSTGIKPKQLPPAPQPEILNCDEEVF
jgi:hypothetical protein